MHATVMATIEPRLIHLLNYPPPPYLQSSSLPPLSSLPRSPLDDVRSLSPLEPVAGPRHHRHCDVSAFAPSALEDMALRHVAAPSLRPPSWVDMDAPDRSPSRVPPADGSDATLKRKDDFVQLPQPVKKQKRTQQAPPMPPIINGLHEPPPHPALFPPIDQHDAGQLKLLCDLNRAPADDRASASDADKNASRARKRAAKPRRKWSDEETEHLLLGAYRHGIGKWTTILEDPDFTFDDRTAGDLKDRFRTCCPDEWRTSPGGYQSDSSPPACRSRKSICSDVSLTDQQTRERPQHQQPHYDHGYNQNHNHHPPDQSASHPEQKKSRAHRKKMEDLVKLGIHGPFKKSHRRERRPFTENDDREILEGLDIYGPAWTRIQRDTRFHLSSRQPTDLRDRVRNKYPGVYQRIEKGTLQAKDDNRGNDILEPSINMSIDDSLKRPKTTATAGNSHSASNKEDMYTWPLQVIDQSPFIQPPQTLDFGEGMSAPPLVRGGSSGGLSVSHLLVDDRKYGPQVHRHAAEGATDPLNPSAPREG
ncbi:MYB DNA-binding domain containing protein [Ophiocordyceps camponoti-floridani]|uniref:MYB DNA-binding domain containing protein n=1 Tax=Ophiocordyceps camponoti-floridani TaxID=2030778 RepID=A0A8H4VBT4_9HYPO|nr:MYB DNA-binding domain containing protein [Ophiocordyceps camponoti-floridani]